MRISDWSSDVCSSDLERLFNQLVRKEPQHAGLGDGTKWTVRSVADWPRVRIFLWLQCGRHQPVGAGAGREHQNGGTAERRSDLYPRQGIGGPRARLASRAAVTAAVPATSHVYSP